MRNIVVFLFVIVATLVASSPAMSQTTTTCVATTQELICCVENPQVGQKVYNQSTQTYWVYCKNGKWANEGKDTGYLNHDLFTHNLVGTDGGKILFAPKERAVWTLKDSYKGRITNRDRVAITPIGNLEDFSTSYWIEDGELKFMIVSESETAVSLDPIKLNVIIWRLE